MTYPVLYLDFDGVLHHEEVWCSMKRGIFIPQHVAPGRTLFEWMPALQNALASFPNVRIVLSTSWVRERSFSFAKSQLSASIQSRVVGATFHNRHHPRHEFLATPRGYQISNDVDRRLPSSWIALDDDAEGWPAWCVGNLVRCNGKLGLSDQVTVDYLIGKLSMLK